MTTKQIQKVREKLDDLYNSIHGSSVYEIVEEIVHYELLLEAESNK